MNPVTCGGKGGDDDATCSRMSTNTTPSTPQSPRSTPQTPRLDVDSPTTPTDAESEEETSETSDSPPTTSTSPTPSDSSDDVSYELAALGYNTPPHSSSPQPRFENLQNGPEPFQFYEHGQYHQPNYPHQFEPPHPPPPTPYVPLPEPPVDLATAMNYLLSTGLFQAPQLGYEPTGYNPPLPSYAHAIQNVQTPFGYVAPESLFYPHEGHPGIFGPPPGLNWIPQTPGNCGNGYGSGGYYPPAQSHHHHHHIYNPGMPMMMPMMMPVRLPPGFQEPFPGFPQGELLGQFQIPFQPPTAPPGFDGNEMFGPYPPRSMAPTNFQPMPPMASWNLPPAPPSTPPAPQMPSWNLPPTPPSTPPAQIRSAHPLNPYSATFFPKTLGSLDVSAAEAQLFGSQNRPGAGGQSLLRRVPLNYRLDTPLVAPLETTTPTADENPAPAQYVSNVTDSQLIAAMKPPPSNFAYYVPPRVDDNDYFGGQIRVWQDHMVSTFGGFTPDLWTLQGLPEFNKYLEGGWSYFTITCKLRFCCRKCKRPWTSMRGKVHFSFKWDAEFPKGTILMKIFGQVCNKENCDGRRFQTPACYPEEIYRVLAKLSEYIAFVHYGFPLSTEFYNEPDKAVRVGNPRSPHRPTLCQACLQGICSLMS